MKKIIFSVYIITLLALAGCYDASGDATVKINLGNIPVARYEQRSFIDMFLALFENKAYAQAAPGTVVRVHVSAINGDAILASGSFDIPGDTDGSSVELSVPAGNGIDIIVIGENSTGTGEYFGYSKADLKTGETTTVNVSPYTELYTQPDNSTWYDKIGMNIVYGETSNTVTWNSPGFHVKYHLYEEEWDGQAYVMVKRYEGYGFSGIDPNGGYHYILYLEFEPFGILSEPFDLNQG